MSAKITAIIAAIVGVAVYLFMKREQSLKESVAKAKYDMTFKRYIKVQQKEKKSEKEFMEAKQAYKQALAEYHAAVSERKRSLSE